MILLQTVAKRQRIKLPAIFLEHSVFVGQLNIECVCPRYEFVDVLFPFIVETHSGNLSIIEWSGIVLVGLSSNYAVLLFCSELRVSISCYHIIQTSAVVEADILRCNS